MIIISTGRRCLFLCEFSDARDVSVPASALLRARPLLEQLLDLSQSTTAQLGGAPVFFASRKALLTFSGTFRVLYAGRKEVGTWDVFLLGYLPVLYLPRCCRQPNLDEGLTSWLGGVIADCIPTRVVALTRHCHFFPIFPLFFRRSQCTLTLPRSCERRHTRHLVERRVRINKVLRNCTPTVFTGQPDSGGTQRDGRILVGHGQSRMIDRRSWTDGSSFAALAWYPLQSCPHPAISTTPTHRTEHGLRTTSCQQRSPSQFFSFPSLVIPEHMDLPKGSIDCSRIWRRSLR